MENIKIELVWMIFVQILSIAFFAGVYVATQKSFKENLLRIEKGFEKQFEDLKKSFDEKIADLKANFHEKFEAVEKKQDKHNNLIERMAIVEQSTKSAHHRIDTITGE